MEQVTPTLWGIIAAVLGVVLTFITRSIKTKDRRADLQRKVAEELRSALEKGDLDAANKAKRKHDYLKSGGSILLALVLVLVFSSGCITKTVPSRPIVLSEHAMFPNDGDTVPSLPKGEVRWLLVSVPTGVDLILPTDLNLTSFNAKQAEIENTDIDKTNAKIENSISPNLYVGALVIILVLGVIIAAI